MTKRPLYVFKESDAKEFEDNIRLVVNDYLDTREPATVTGKLARNEEIIKRVMNNFRLIGK